MANSITFATSAGKRFERYLLTFLQTQCALTIVSTPILIYWGLGISVASIVGNFLFAPVLLLFLLLCTLIFFSGLCGLPHQLLDWLVNLITSFWHYALGFGNQQWIVYCVRPPVIILALPIVALIICLHHPKISSPAKRLLAMGSILLAFLTYCTIQQRYTLLAHPTVVLHEKLYAVVRADNALAIIDHGFCTQKKSPEKVVDFEILPALAKHYGNLPIAEYTILKPSRGSMKAAEQICKKLSVKKVILPYFSKPADKSTWRAYFDLKRTLEEKNIIFTRYNEQYLDWWRYKLRSWAKKDSPLKIAP
jgi:hypothetical protein